MIRRITLFAMLIFFAEVGIAQHSPKLSIQDLPVVKSKHLELLPAQYDVSERFVNANPMVNAVASSDTLWYSDFEDPTHWTFQNQGGNGWHIVDQGSETGWFLNPLTSTSGGKRAEMDNGDPATATNAEQTMVTTNPIDVSGISGSCVLEFQQRTRRFRDIFHIEASNNGTAWTEIGRNEHLLSSTDFNATIGSASNPEYLAYYIPESISGAGNNNLWIRFRWEEMEDDGVGYGWIIDDVTIYKGGDNDLSIEETFYLGQTDSGAFYKYTQIPELQGANSSFVPAASVTNLGNIAQANVTLSTASTAAGYTSSAASINLNPSGLALPEVGTFFQPSGTGTYDLVYTVDNGQPEWIDINNTSTWTFELTENLWAYDDNSAQAAAWYGNSGYTICAYYDHFTDDTIRGIDAYMPMLTNDGTDFGLQNGQVVGAVIYNAAADSILGDNPFYTVNDGPAETFVDGWFSIPLEIPVAGSREGYYACLAVYNDETPIGVEYDSPDGLAIVDSDNSGTFGLPITTADIDHNVFPMIRVRTSNPTICQSTNITVNSVVTDDFNAGISSASIDISISGNFTPPLTIEWDGPGSFDVIDGEDVENITVPGVYTVTVTDLNGCAQTTEVITVITGIEASASAEVFSVYPNPANDKVRLTFTTSEEHEVTLFNAHGEVIQQYAVSGINMEVDLSSEASGIYFLQAEDAAGRQTHRLVIQ